MKRILLLVICTLMFLPGMAKHHKKSSSKSHHKTHYVRRKIDQSIEHDTLSTPVTLVDSLIYEASKHLGKPYRSGNKGPYAFDCSGFTSFVYKQFGIQLGSNSRDQFLQGVKISREHAKKGDLVFFAGHDSRGGVGHVGIVFDVAPDGKSFRFIHAANSVGISIARYPDMGYYSKRFRGIRRIIDGTTAPVPADNTFYAVPLPSTNLSLDDKQEGNINLSVSQEERTHTVKKGENIYSIAKKYGCTSGQIMKWNKLTKGAKLSVGQTLIVKPETKKPQEYLDESIAEAEEKKNATTDNVTVSVQDGETIYSLSQKYHCTVKEITRWNNLKGNTLKTGQEIKIRPVTASAKKDSIINGELVHTVNKGENIYQISRKYGCQVKEIKQWNKLTSNVLSEGKQIVIKHADKGDVHTVKNGETLNSLASKYGCTVAELKKWNHLNSNSIRSGMMLKVKEGAGIDHLLPNAPEVAQNEKATPTNATASATSKSNTTEAASASDDNDNESYTYYTVKGGDTFRRIATKFGCTTNQIMEWNDLNSYVLRPGKKLIVGKGKDAAEKAIAEETKTVSNKKASAVKVQQPKDDIDIETEKGGDTYYTVRSGDTFRRIANKYGCTTGQIMTWNHLKGYTLRPGTQLIVRKGTGVKKQTVTNTELAENTPSPVIEKTATPVVENPQKATNNKQANDKKVVDNSAKTTVEPAKQQTVQQDVEKATPTKQETAKQEPAKKEVAKKEVEKKESPKQEATKQETAKVEEAKEETESKDNVEEDANYIYHYVKSGDTFRRIANKYGCTTAQIMEWNNLKSYALRGNQKLIVGKKKSATKTNATKANTTKEVKKVETPSNDDTSNSSVESGDNIYYYVQGGDTFKKIANKYGCTTAQIMEWNNLKSYALRGNQKLIVGKKKSSNKTTKTESQVSTNAADEVTYTVKSGDNLSSISRKYGCSVSQLKEWNKLSSDNLSLGQKLIIKK